MQSLGPNGAGKTTCFYMIVGLVPCGEGRIELDNVDLTGAPMHQRARYGLGYLPQEASIFRKLSVADNIMAVLEIRKDLNKANRKELLESLLHELHIGHLAGLAADPRFILLDEPFAGVDPISVIDIQNIIKHLCDRDIGILITDHNVREMLGICHHAYILNAGKVIATGTPDEVLNDQHVRDVYLGSEFRL